MPSKLRRWLAPPTRRELTLLVFAFSLFVLSYNLETSLRLVGVSRDTLDSLNAKYIGIGTNDPGLEADGRRPLAWRDELERLIAGDWEWKEGHIAALEHAQDSLSLAEAERQGLSYVYNAGKDTSRTAGSEVAGVGVTSGITGMEQILKINWGKEGAQTRALAHVPGYTILQNVFVMNGTFFLVTDSPASLPPLGSIASSSLVPTRPPQPQDWRIIPSENASETLGIYGGRLHGTTWLSTDPADSLDPYTVFSLFRTHAHMLSPRTNKFKTIATGGLPEPHTTTPPTRLIFPNLPTFSSPQLGTPPGGEEVKEHPPLRVKSFNGLHPQFLRAVFPTITVAYAEDWEDIAGMAVPYVFDYLVVADSAAASRGRDQWTIGWTPPPRKTVKTELRKRQGDGDSSDISETGRPIWAAPFVGLPAPENWWTPVRASLLSYLGLPADSASVPEAPATTTTTKKFAFWGSKSQPVVPKRVLTYVSMQDEPVNAGSRLKQEDHIALLKGLQGLLQNGVLNEVHVVRNHGTKEVWGERMRAISRSNFVIGPFGSQLSDSLFMRVPPPSPPPSKTEDDDGQPEIKPQPAPLLIEFFPPTVFRRDQEFAARSVGIRYIAWWSGRLFSGNSLPPVMADINQRVPHLEDSLISLDVDAILNVISEEAIKFVGRSP
ncbi:hypothetical protein BXZ70DRAFT_927885 [Cristinia sonorae]|uniref:Uncharacterized protein n=1 Tax=Cristinia sonorae TaxID=1940300 RepID=A0A8K0USS7_9AGAR|nr:hypothetical protein BXZ70DRAFT_927885 [Cristinia sonorae]